MAVSGGEHDDKRWTSLFFFLVSLNLSNFFCCSVMWFTKLKECFYSGTLDAARKHRANLHIPDAISNLSKIKPLIPEVLLMMSGLLFHVPDTMQQALGNEIYYFVILLFLMLWGTTSGLGSLFLTSSCMSSRKVEQLKNNFI